MAFSDVSNSTLAYIEESTWGTTPSTPELTQIRKKSENIKSNVSVVVSDEVRSDRQVPDQSQVGGGVSNGFTFELSFAEYDPFIEHGLMSAYSTVETITGTDLALSGASLTSTASAFTASKNKVGQWIKVSGSATSSNNGIYKISSYAAGSLGLTDSAGGTASFTSDSSNASLSYSSSAMLRNGTTKKSMTIEKGFSDITKYFQFTGMRTSDITLELTEQAILQGSVNFVGKGTAIASSSIDNSGGYTASTSNPIMNASGNITSVHESGASFSGSFKSFTIGINNNLENQTAVGSADLAGVGVGRCEVTGDMSLYLEDTSLFTKFTGNTGTSFAFIVKDSSNNYYIFTIPNAKFTDNDIPTDTGSVIQSFSYQGFRDTTTDCQIQIDKISA
jgi:hypothetical protein